jgi:hypothetical protein
MRSDGYKLLMTSWRRDGFISCTHCKGLEHQSLRCHVSKCGHTVTDSYMCNRRCITWNALTSHCNIQETLFTILLSVNTIYVQKLLYLKSLQHVSVFRPSSGIVHVPLTYVLFPLHCPMFIYGCILCSRYLHISAMPLYLFHFTTSKY